MAQNKKLPDGYNAEVAIICDNAEKHRPTKPRVLVVRMARRRQTGVWNPLSDHRTAPRVDSKHKKDGLEDRIPKLILDPDKWKNSFGQGIRFSCRVCHTNAAFSESEVLFSLLDKLATAGITEVNLKSIRNRGTFH